MRWWHFILSSHSIKMQFSIVPYFCIDLTIYVNVYVNDSAPCASIQYKHPLGNRFQRVIDHYTSRQILMIRVVWQYQHFNAYKLSASFSISVHLNKIWLKLKGLSSYKNSKKSQSVIQWKSLAASANSFCNLDLIIAAKYFNINRCVVLEGLVSLQGSGKKLKPYPNRW